MVRARQALLERGGAIKANVFTRILLALYGETAWSNVHTVPVELILLPRWFPIHLSKMSYWARTVIVPLLVLAARRPLARNPRGVHVPELFVPGVPAASPRAPHQSAGWSAFFGALDWCLKRFEPFWPKGLRARAIERCRTWTTERLNGEDGLGAIYPAMANSVMMYDVLGYAPSHPDRAIARLSVEKLLVIKDHEAYCQPCVSPVWDTAQEAPAPSNTATIIIPISTTPRWGGWRWTVPPNPAFRRNIKMRSRAEPNGSMACRAGRGDGAPSMPKIPIITSTTSLSPITAPCSTRPPRTCPAAAWA